MVPLKPPVFALPLAALAHVAISREHIGLGVGKTVVDPPFGKGMGSARLLGFSAHEGQRFPFPTPWRLLARSTSRSGFPTSLLLFCFASLHTNTPLFRTLARFTPYSVPS